MRQSFGIHSEPIPAEIKARPDRCRKRQSFPLFGLYRLDMTEVVQDHQQQYEVEMEINPDLLRQEYSRRSKGRPNVLYPVVSDFIANLRGMAAYLNNKNDVGQTAMSEEQGYFTRRLLGFKRLCATVGEAWTLSAESVAYCAYNRRLLVPRRLERLARVS